MDLKVPKDRPSRGNIPFLKLKDGESVKGVFKGEPRYFYQKWGEGEVPEGTPGAAWRFELNFVTKDGASYVAKVFSQGTRVMKRLEFLNKKKPLERLVVEITRSGSTKDDTEYFIEIADTQPNEAGWRVIDAVKLVDLGGSKEESEPQFEDSPMPDYGDEPPF
jgi:hypothetical protein